MVITPLKATVPGHAPLGLGVLPLELSSLPDGDKEIVVSPRHVGRAATV